MVCSRPYDLARILIFQAALKQFGEPLAIGIGGTGALCRQPRRKRNADRTAAARMTGLSRYLDPAFPGAGCDTFRDGIAGQQWRGLSGEPADTFIGGWLAMFGCPEQIAGRLLCDARLQGIGLAAVAVEPFQSLLQQPSKFQLFIRIEGRSGDDGHRHQPPRFPNDRAGGSVGVEAIGSDRGGAAVAGSRKTLQGLHGARAHAALAGSAYQQQIELCAGKPAGSGGVQEPRRLDRVAPILSAAQKKHTQIVLGDGVTRPGKRLEKSGT
jgi:hypothetical protein